MASDAKQTVTGKAFEYALMNALLESLSSVTSVTVVDSAPYRTAKKSYSSFDGLTQDQYKQAATAAIGFLLELEPRLSNHVNELDVLQLEIVSDIKGQVGDVRDVLAIRSSQDWEIGISAKHNHRAVKHSRLSNDIDFGEKWLGSSCSSEYFSAIKPVFDKLSHLRSESKATKTWDSLGDYHSSVYVPILTAFKCELLRLVSDSTENLASRLVEYLIGTRDFYKVIKAKSGVEIQAYNLNGTLNLPFKTLKSKTQIQKLKLPSRLIEVVFQKGSKTTLLVTCDEGWQITFRIHNASSRIEPSLKFDINLVSTPHTLFTHRLTL